MRKLISTVMQLAGIGCLVAAAFAFSTVIGVAVLGAALFVVGNVAEGH